MLVKHVGGCTEATVRVYRAWLAQLRTEVGDDIFAIDTIAITRFFAGLRGRELSTSSVHQAYRTLKTFFRWLVASGVFSRNPMVDFRMRTPRPQCLRCPRRTS